MAFSPSRLFTLAWPKKYQPTMVEKAKNSMQMAMKISPALPNTEAKAYWLRAAPVRPEAVDPVDRITSAVRVRMMKVSRNTPTMAAMP